jgi:predicted ATPase
MAQVLPVLVALALARRAAAEGQPQLLALEQPELHLHPAAEVALARRLAEVAAAEKPPTLLIETHSENFLLSVQLQVAKELLPPEAVRIYWVEKLSDGRSRVREVAIDGEGRTEGWPEGVFSEDLELARELFLQRRQTRGA